MSDKQLRQDVLDELEFEPSVDATSIGVTLDKGIVTLSGHVPTFWQKTAAERTVWRVKGVKAIAQEIEVRFGNGKKDADDQIAERAVQAPDVRKRIEDALRRAPRSKRTTLPSMSATTVPSRWKAKWTTGMSAARSSMRRGRHPACVR